MKYIIRIAILVFLANCLPVHGGTKLLRFPDIHGDSIVFCYAGDIWRVSTAGGLATRLTAHPGLELFPKFSPDGSQIAFTGQYDGDEQVYVVDSHGGVPQQLTYYPAQGPLPDRWGFDNQVYGWTPDGQSVLFRSMRHGWTLTDTRLYTVSTQGGLPQQLPMSVSGAGDFSPDGKQIVFSPLTRDFRTWKRYQGGWAQDLYTFDLENMEATQLTNHPRSDRDPMWIGDRIYFSSDRKGTLNLYYADASGESEPRVVTDFENDDVRWPSMGGTKIIFELNGELRIFHTETDEITEIDIIVPTDGLAARPRRVKGSVNDFGLSPSGKRAILESRGDIFSAPTKKGTIRNLTRSSSAHEKDASWSPDGKWIAYISDRTGEEELFAIDPLGKGPPRQLTSDGTSMRHLPEWSPDSKSIAISDKDGKLSVIDVDSKTVTQIADESDGRVLDYQWSPHSGHLAFSLTSPNGMNAIHIWSASDATLRKITGDHFNEYQPVWDPQGKYLYYLSDREFAPQIGNQEWNFVQNRSTGVFALALRKDVEHPYPPEEDTESDDDDESDKDADDEAKESDTDDDKSADSPTKDEKGGEDDKEEEEEDEDDEPIQIDFEGLAERVARVPVEADNLASLSAIEGHLIYVARGAFYYGRDSGVTTDLIIFSHEDREDSVLAEEVSGYTLSADGSHVLFQGADGLQLIEAAADSEAEAVSTSSLMVNVVPQEEWKQIFHEVWRRFRDFFYVDNLHGNDWEAIRQKYEPLLEHVAHRSDLNYVIGEMIGELNVGHAYKAGGDYEQPQRPDVALPGAVIELDSASGKYRLAKIFGGHNEEDVYRSPATEVAVDLAVGDYLLEIDGEPLNANDNPYRMLRFKSDRPVTLTVNDKPSEEDSRQVVINPTDDEADLVYLDWVTSNYNKVEAATNGTIGYLHLPNMGQEGIREFNKWFYSQLRKQGLIIDVRSNGGGNVSQMVIDRLRRTLLATGFSRTSDIVSTYPQTVFHGHLVCLLDEDSASDGDIFPAMFREANLGPLIGKRSWGGVIGITNRGTLIDGGNVFVPEFGFASADGRWVIEGHGVDPDIEVDNDPKSLIEGRDPQLERAIVEITRMVKENPKTLPTRPAPPDKSK